MLWTARDVRRGDETLTDSIAVEEPLEIRIDGQALVVTMRTPGHDLDLAAGFLLTEGVLEDLDDLSALEQVGPNIVDSRLASGVAAHREAIERATRSIVATSSCGLCGKSSLDQVRVKATHPLVHVPLDVASAPDRLTDGQVGFQETGGLHGAGLLTADGTVRVVREDIGRHNAVDKVLGWRLRTDTREALALVVTSRAGFEIVQKARVAGIGTIVSVGAASSLAVDLARDQGMHLYGFVRGARFNRYA